MNKAWFSKALLISSDRLHSDLIIPEVLSFLDLATKIRFHHKVVLNGRLPRHVMEIASTNTESYILHNAFMLMRD